MKKLVKKYGFSLEFHALKCKNPYILMTYPQFNSQLYLSLYIKILQKAIEKLKNFKKV